MEEITGKKIVYYSVNLLNKDALKEVFSKVIAKNTCVFNFDTIGIYNTVTDK